MSRNDKYIRSSAGFTLLEVLVTIFVIALALLGTAGLQAYGMKVTQSGQLRTQAVILGLDMLERIEANNPAAVAGNYVVNPLPTAVPADCFAVLCTPAELATYDLVQFGIVKKNVNHANVRAAVAAHRHYRCYRQVVYG